MKKMKKETNLGKLVHVYNSREDAMKQFNRDVATMGKMFNKLVEDYFQMNNPYDQCVLEAILTNLLAFVEIHVECDGTDMQKAIKEDFEQYLEMYRKQVKRQQEQN